MVLTAKSIVEDSIRLYSLPDVYFQVREMVRDPRFTVAEIGQVIAKDPALSIRLLKIVNSSFYGFPARVDTISRAISIVGMNELYNLVLATSVVDTFKEIPDDLIDMTDFWIQSVNCAIIAKLLARKSAVLHEERLFLAGLLHDIGALVIYAKLPEQAVQMLLKAGRNRFVLTRLEQELIGFTRAEVGGELAQVWGLPESLSEAIYCQLRPDSALTHKLDAYLLSLAISLSNNETTVDEALAAVPKDTLSMLRMDRAQIDQILAAAVDEFNSIFDVLAPGKRFH
ncbi:MAG: HDOD domain-containing protein [Gammaproteobacteria bacterium]